MKTLFILCLLVLVQSCSNKNTAEYVLRDFISKRFSGNADKEYILSKVTGEMKEEITSMTDEQYNVYQNLPELKKQKVIIQSKRCTKESCFITYIVSYNTQENSQTAFRTETKKIAEIIKEGDEWKISKISHIKTFHDSAKEINPLEN